MLCDTCSRQSRFQAVFGKAGIEQVIAVNRGLSPINRLFAINRGLSPINAGGEAAEAFAKNPLNHPTVAGKLRR